MFVRHSDSSFARGPVCIPSGNSIGQTLRRCTLGPRELGKQEVHWLPAWALPRFVKISLAQFLFFPFLFLGMRLHFFWSKVPFYILIFCVGKRVGFRSDKNGLSLWMRLLSPFLFYLQKSVLRVINCYTSASFSSWPLASHSDYSYWHFNNITWIHLKILH